MVETLRAERGTALMFANGGYATHFHAIVLCADALPDARFPHDFDVNPLAATLRSEAPPVEPAYVGPATIETYTVFYHRDARVRFGTIIARTPTGGRVLARVSAEDNAMIAFLSNGHAEPVGAAGQTQMGADGLMHWRAA
jgi:acetyl-CoA C-acetyltransferase